MVLAIALGDVPKNIYRAAAGCRLSVTQVCCRPLGAYLVDIIRRTSPVLKLRRFASVRHVCALPRTVLQSDMIIIRDKEPLTRCAVASTGLNPQRSSVDAESRTEFDAEVGVGYLNGGSSRVVDESLSVRVVACRTAREIWQCQRRARTQQSIRLGKHTQQGPHSPGCSHY